MEEQEEIERYLSRYQKRKKRERFQSWLGITIGTLIVVNSYSPVPIPLIGIPSILIGLGILGYGLYQRSKWKTLPIHEALMLGRSQQNFLTRTDLFLAFKLSITQTDELIQTLIQEGLIEAINENIDPETEIRYRIIS